MQFSTLRSHHGPINCPPPRLLQLKEAIEEQSKVTDDDGESYIRRSKSYIRKAFPRIPGKQIDEAEGKIESFIREEEERMNGEKNGQGKCE